MNNVDRESAMPIKNSWPCWNCKTKVTMTGRADADGACPHCKVELDIELWPFPQNSAPVVERAGLVQFEIVGRECIPSPEMAAVAAYRKTPWVDGNVLEMPSTPGYYRIEPLIRNSEAQAEIALLREQLDSLTAAGKGVRDAWREDQQRLAAAEQRNAELEKDRDDWRRRSTHRLADCQEMMTALKEIERDTADPDSKNLATTTIAEILRRAKGNELPIDPGASA